MGFSEFLEQICLYIYRLPLYDLTRASICAALVLCTLYRRCTGQRWLQPCIAAALILWFGVALRITLLGRTGGGTQDSSWIPLHTYWQVLRGANIELLRSAFMNSLLFFPAGLLLGSLLPGKLHFRLGLPLLVLFSVTIELCQYQFHCGYCEIDDVLHNALGAGLGFSAFRAFEHSLDP